VGKNAVRTLVLVGVISAAVFFSRGPISDFFHPPPPIQHTGFDGEVRPGGEATRENFDRLRLGMPRHDVWSILGEASGREGWAGEWWDRPEFTIGLSYDEKYRLANGWLQEGENRAELRK
jgi:hypothetical protein